jgi:hypothetical protein
MNAQHSYRNACSFACILCVYPIRTRINLRVFTLAVYGNGMHYSIFTGGDIVNPESPAKTNPKTFRLVLKTTDAINANSAAAFDWNLRWCGVGDVKKPPEEQFAMCCGSHKGFNAYGGNAITTSVDTREFSFQFLCVCVISSYVCGIFNQGLFSIFFG